MQGTQTGTKQTSRHSIDSTINTVRVVCGEQAQQTKGENIDTDIKKNKN